jgi:penicillin-binding protein 2
VTEPRTRTRLKVLAALVAFMFGALTTRLWFLQVLAAPQFSQEANANQVRLVTIDPTRGEILDRNGNVLVANARSLAIVIDRQALGAQRADVIAHLSAVLNVPAPQLVARLDSPQYLPYEEVPVAFGVSTEVAYFVSEHTDEFPGVSVQELPVRTYPEGDLAAHVLGYLYRIDADQLKEPQYAGYQPDELIGQSGVEATYQQYLRGMPGTREVQVDAQGDVLDPNFRTSGAKPGDDVVLSIDENIQRLAQQSLLQGIAAARHTLDTSVTPATDYRAPAGAVIVMDPKTGQVLALSSYPTFDPSAYVGGLTAQEADSLDLNSKLPPTHDYPLFDRATGGQYAPGSTFKPFIATAAFHDGYANPNVNYPCPASYTVPGDTSGTVFDNWNPVDSGSMTVSQALIVSCDTVFYRFGYDYWVRYVHTGGNSGHGQLQLQQDLLQEGFGHDTGIDIPGEASGVVPTPEYTKAVYERQKQQGLAVGQYYGWQPGDDINMSIGQGFAQVTPLQLAVGYSAIANGGKLMVPHVGWKIVDPQTGATVRTIEPKVNGRLPITKQQIAYIRDALTAVPQRGTAATAFLGFPLSQVPVAGKTGTAQVNGKQDTSWFAAMAPANDPRYVVVAMVEQAGHGSTTAAPIVRRILQGLFGLGTTKVVTGNIQD